ADLLLLPEAPRYVVLTGCRTAAEPGVGLSLAEALLMAGTNSVVAASRAASDQASAQLGLCLARQLGPRLGDRGDGGPLEESWKACASPESHEEGYELWVR
ncbi:MAG: hypothetical protein AAFZ18_02175, partial [Myxococcota bacterium]